MQPSMREKSQRGFLLPWKFTDTLCFGFESGSGLAARLQVEISLLLLVVGQTGFSSCMSSLGPDLWVTGGLWACLIRRLSQRWHERMMLMLWQQSCCEQGPVPLQPAQM